jgi:hypothetical protein
MPKRLKKIRSVLVFGGGVLIFCILPVKAEEIFRWIDENGDISFSNIAPPSAGIEYSKKSASTVHANLNRRANQPILPIMKTVSASDQETTTIDHRAMKNILQKKIEEGKRVIYKIESLLKKKSNSQTLRQHLFRKRIRLLEDINRLSSM